MMTALLGRNFSGRGRWLEARRRDRPWPLAALVGPTGDTSFTGLCWSVAEELRSASAAGPREGRENERIISTLGLSQLLDQPLHVLSGGETVRAALASALAQGVNEVHVYCALEQLDPESRSHALHLLGEDAPAFVVDNRLRDEDRAVFNDVITFPLHSGDQLERLPLLHPEQAKLLVSRVDQLPVRIADVTFRYPTRPNSVLKDATISLAPGRICFLRGPNGSGKTTLVRLLSGTIVPNIGAISFGDVVFKPQRRRRYLAISFQNPDYQWTTGSVSSAVSSLYLSQQIHQFPTIGDALVAFGIPPSLSSANPVDLPFVFKKRLANMLAICSDKPWMVLDEPTLAQDEYYVASLGSLLETASALGKGSIVISHDQRLAAALPAASRYHISCGRVLAC